MPPFGDAPAWHELVAGEDAVLLAEDSAAAYVFSIGPLRGDIERTARLRAAVWALCGRLRPAYWCEQIHGAEVIVVSSVADTLTTGPVGQGDALVTTTPGVGLAVWTADCVPILLAGGGAVAAVHSGWRGTAAGIVSKAVLALASLGATPSGLRAFLGPAIGPCHYPVGAEVIAALERTGIPTSEWLHGDAVDLRALVRSQLVAAGVTPAAVSPVGCCTACDHRLASFRRDGRAAGRQWSMVMAKPSEAVLLTHPEEGP